LSSSKPLRIDPMQEYGRRDPSFDFKLKGTVSSHPNIERSRNTA
jgi:hypothetical protein